MLHLQEGEVLLKGGVGWGGVGPPARLPAGTHYRNAQECQREHWREHKAACRRWAASDADAQA